MRIGCDLVCLKRFATSVAKEAFVVKVFHAAEIDACRKKADPVASFAARYAAKEAFVKALGTGLYTQGVGPTDVWVEQHENGRPYLKFSPRVAQLLERENLKGADVSLSHHGEYAMATVLLF